MSRADTMDMATAQALRTDVSALYVDRLGPYPKLVADWWDAERDARNYAGPLPVVAHPPCRNWSSLRHLAKGDDRDCGIRAVEQVREFGGVLEQPAGSKLWEHCGLPMTSVDSETSFSLEVSQVSWGHVARKRTWLWIHGVRRSLVVPTIRTGGTPTHWCSGGRTKSSRRGSPVPPGIKVCSAQQRRRTPLAFAEWLLSLAAQARRPEHAS